MTMILTYTTQLEAREKDQARTIGTIRTNRSWDVSASFDISQVGGIYLRLTERFELGKTG